MSGQDQEGANDASEARHNQKRGAGPLLVISMFGGGILLLILLLYFVY